METPSFFTHPIDRSVSESEMRRRIQSLNLLPVKEKLMTSKKWGGLGWSRKKANTVEEAYRGFLFVYWKYDDCAPNSIIDDFWHTHILMTQKYIEDCYFLWGAYAHHVPSPAPRKSLIKAVEYSPSRGTALDIGSGNMRDTRHLLVRGFEVTAVDVKPTDFQHQGVTVLHQDITETSFDDNSFDLVNAQFVLPFVHEDEKLIESIYTWLKPNGVFVGQFFGRKDEWAGNIPLHFYSKKDAQRIINKFKTIRLWEEKCDFNTMNGAKKYWHTIEFIVRK